MCIGCHGISGYQANFPEVYKVPKIGGQDAKYITAALEAYKAGRAQVPSMRAIADSLTEQDMADVAAYYSGHGRATELQAQPAREPTPRWRSCCKGRLRVLPWRELRQAHRPLLPQIAGQYADYLYVALRRTRDGSVPTLSFQRHHGGHWRSFTNAELKALAGYVGSLDTNCATVPEPRFR